MNDWELADTATFIAVWAQTLASVQTYEQAYDIVEARYFMCYKKQKFTDFDSFRQTMYYHLRKERGK